MPFKMMIGLVFGFAIMAGVTEIAAQNMTGFLRDISTLAKWIFTGSIALVVLIRLEEIKR